MHSDEPPSSIGAALSGDRPDMAVSLWLQARMAGDFAGLPREVVVAYRADKFLQEVNMGGFEGFFTWERENVEDTIEALRTVGLEQEAEALQVVLERLVGSYALESDEALRDALASLHADAGRRDLTEKLGEVIVAGSKNIEKRTQAYIRANLSTFAACDD